MAQLSGTKYRGDRQEALQRRARRHGRSMAEEVREILREATKSSIPGLIKSRAVLLD